MLIRLPKETTHPTPIMTLWVLKFQSRSSKERSQEPTRSRCRASFLEDLAIGSYRHAASSVIPKVTKVAWHFKKDEIQNSHPNETQAQFIYHMSKSEYRKDWGKIYEKPGVVARAKALFLKSCQRSAHSATWRFIHQHRL